MGAGGQFRAEPRALDGVFVAIAGPSGAGKDTLIDHARAHYETRGARILFVRRIVTRPAGSVGEDHDTLDERAFDEAEAAGRFACAWRANGLRYALPAEIERVLASGGVVVANVSRAAIGELRRRYPRLVSVLVTAPDAVLAGRLAARGRESRAEIMARLARNTRYGQPVADQGNVIIDNSSTPEEGGRHLVAILDRALEKAALAQA